MTRFARQLGILTLRRTEHRWVRELAIGAAAGVLCAAGMTLLPVWTVFALIAYGIVTQTVALVPNDVFWSFAELRRFGFASMTWPARVAYLAHYVARDLVGANASFLLVSSSLVAWKVGLGEAALIWLVFLANLALIPSHIYLASRLSERGRNTYLAALWVGLSLAGVTLALIGPTQVAADRVGAATVAATALLILVVDRISARLRPSSAVHLGGRSPWLWLRRLAPFQFKDLVMFAPLLALGIGTSCALLALLAIDAKPHFIPFLTYLALGTDNSFLARRNKQYRIIAEDPWFSAQALPRDAAMLLQQKVGTLALDALIRATIGAAVIGIATSRWDYAALMPAILLVGLILSIPLLRGTAATPRWLRRAVQYLVIVVATTTVLTQQSALPAALTAALVAIIFLPQAMAVLRPQRPKPSRSEKELIPGAVAGSVAQLDLGLSRIDDVQLDRTDEDLCSGAHP